MNLRMKKLLLLLVITSNLTFGQTDENYKINLNNDFIEYNNLILKQDLEKAMDFVLPEFFEIIPRNQMILLLKQVYNNPELEFKWDKPKDVEYRQPKKIGEKYYSEITYSSDIEMKFNNLEYSKDEEQNELIRNLTKLNIEKTYGSGNVNFNKETEFYKIHIVKKAYGISENGISDWKFVVVDPKQKFILEKILPKELTEKL